MIRWLVRKVVKYTLEELIQSEDLKWLVDICIHQQRPTVEESGTGPALPTVGKQSGAVEVDSTMDIAKAMIGGGSDVKIAVKNESTTVSSNKERNADVIGRLSELGD